MGIPSFFKTPRHKQFNYEPLYYDERKEKLQERMDSMPYFVSLSTISSAGEYSLTEHGPGL